MGPVCRYLDSWNPGDFTRISAGVTQYFQAGAKGKRTEEHEAAWRPSQNPDQKRV